MSKREWTTVDASDNEDAARIKEIMDRMVDAYDFNDVDNVTAIVNVAIKMLMVHDHSEEDVVELIREMYAGARLREAEEKNSSDKGVN